jgi:hypothetical protein
MQRRIAKEFSACVEIPDEVKKIADLVNGFQHLYNYPRRHGALAGATPAQYQNTPSQQRPAGSYVMGRELLYGNFLCSYDRLRRRAGLKPTRQSFPLR